MTLRAAERRAKVSLTTDDLTGCVDVLPDDYPLSPQVYMGEPTFHLERIDGAADKEGLIAAGVMVWQNRSWKTPVFSGGKDPFGIVPYMRARGASRQVAAEAAADSLRRAKQTAVRLYDEGTSPFGVRANVRHVITLLRDAHRRAGVPFTQADRYDAAEAAEGVTCWGYCDLGDGREKTYAVREAAENIAHGLRSAGWIVDGTADNATVYRRNRAAEYRRRINGQNRD